MAENSKIEWTDHTFNPWLGCTKVSPGCVNCYAEHSTPVRVFGVEWGKGKKRMPTSDANWKKPLAWNRKAEKEGTRYRVFCASLSDWLDNEVPIDWLAELLTLIFETPHLDWQLLTKRPQNFRSRLKAIADGRVGGFSASFNSREWYEGRWIPPNVWVGTTVENQEAADVRIPQLELIPAHTRFLSCEPLIQKVDLHLEIFTKISWVIIGGESGVNARVCDASWMRSLVRQCSDYSVPAFLKQMGSNFNDGDFPERNYRFSDRKGGNIDEFPFDLQYRQFPVEDG